MPLVPNWRRVLLRAWSLWPVYLVAVFELAAELAPYLSDLLPRWLIVAILLLNPLLRIIRQGALHATEQDPRNEPR